MNFPFESSAKEVRQKEGTCASKKMSRGDLTIFDQHAAHKLTNFCPHAGAVPHSHPWGPGQHEGCWIFRISSEGWNYANKVS